jgi:thioredoxin-related protein
MLKYISLLILVYTLSLCTAEEIACQKITLADGRIFIGNYDADTGIIKLINEKTGKSIADFTIKKADIQKQENITVSIVQTDPKEKYGLDGRWLTNYQAALRLAKESKRPIMTLFTGSDWCPSCILLEKEIINTKEFKAWAAKHFVLLKIDFPNNGYAVSLRKANEEVAKKFAVKSYPTILFIGADEKPNPWKWGYSDVGVEKWMEIVNQSLKLAK